MTVERQGEGNAAAAAGCFPDFYRRNLVLQHTHKGNNVRDRVHREEKHEMHAE
jgi:hypothetical protein